MLKGLLKKGDGAAAGAPATIFAHPMVQDMLQKAAHLRSDLMDQFDDRFNGLAKKLKLATRGEMKLLKRQIRELENQVANLEHQLAQERARAERADDALAEASRTTKKFVEQKTTADVAAKELEAKIVALQAELAARADSDDKPAARKAPRATSKKKAETADGNDGAQPADEGTEGCDTLL